MKYQSYVLVTLMCFTLFACDDLVEVNVPNDRITSETVFSKDETANSAVVGIYNQLFQATFSSGGQTSVTVLAGLSADNLQATVSTTNLLEFEENEIFNNNSYNLGIWSSAYNTIYMTNAVLDGIDNNTAISAELKAELSGEARFLRAFTYFYLVNLYGDVPLVLSTDYQNNAVVSRTDTTQVFNQIVEDLESAINLLGTTYENGERLRANSYTATALLARVHLYLENWEMAEQLSTSVIDASGIFELLPLNEVFLANSREAIWQISPIAGGLATTNTNEGALFIMQNTRGNIALTENFMASIDTLDTRRDNWIGSFDSETNKYYFPYKYKVKNSTEDASEYSMVMRLAEQYLIRAEARLKQGKIMESIEDLDRIRLRAGLKPIAEINPETTSEELLDLILLERRRELFGEWGHRWLDLKRTGRAKVNLPPLKPLWEDTDVFYPIPEDELRKNLNLTQNPGY